MPLLCGGTSEVKPADQKIQDIADSVKSQVEEKAGKKYCKFLVKSYKSQVVAGTNFFMKVSVSLKEDHIHVRVFQGLPHTGGALEVHGLQESKSHHDPIEYF
uniref:Cystatin-B n=1 Tax=Periophthalmus magnuspinnatus TaxID=409849 RepID=A0A3B4BLW0_9GOBI